MSDVEFIMIKDNYDDVVIGQGQVVKSIEKKGKTLISLDGYLFCERSPIDKKYNVEFKTEKTVGEPIPLKYKEGYSVASLSDDVDADLYIDLTKEEIETLCEDVKKSVMNVIDDETSIDYEKGVIYAETNIKSPLVTRILQYPPTKLDMFSVEDKEDHIEIHIKSEGLVKFIHLTKLVDYIREYLACHNKIYDETTLVYYNNMGRRSFQWELWAMCNNLCKYCYLGSANRGTNKERQMKSLHDLHAAIDNLDFNIYNNISMIGGEFFQGQLDDPEVHDSFMDLIRKICVLYNEKKIGSVWITCTMTIGDQKHLYEMLDIFEEYGVKPYPEHGASGLWLCTSWDIEGRFHTPQHLANWEYHMENIHQKYPWVKFNCTIILMQKFLEAYINGEWSPKAFMEKYHTGLFYKQIGLGEIPDGIFNEITDHIELNREAKKYTNKKFGFDFAPKRETMLKFLRKYALEDPETYDNLFNIIYRADELHRNFNDKTQDVKTKRNKFSANESDVEQDNRMNTCGHILNYACYIDSDKCCICDKKMIWESIYGDEKW